VPVPFAAREGRWVDEDREYVVRTGRSDCIDDAKRLYALAVLSPAVAYSFIGNGRARIDNRGRSATHVRPNQSIRVHGMRQRTKHFLVLVAAQAACLAFGLWLDNRLILSLVHNRNEQGQRTPAAVGNSMTLTAFQPGARSAAPIAMAQDPPAMAIHAITFLWIAALQTVVAYLSLTQMQEVVTRKQTETERVSLQRHNDLLRTRDAVIFGLAGLADSRDPETGKHLERIAAYSSCLATALARHPNYREQVTASFVKLIGISSALHDIGKVGIRDAILLKPGKFEDRERRLMQLHAAIGGQCVRDIEARLGNSNFLQMAREIALCHHERWDGTGYPKKLAGNAIPLAARIVAVADVYDALSNRRVYKEAFPHEKCVEIIAEGAGASFDPEIVAVFLERQAEFRDIAQWYRDASKAMNEEPPCAEETVGSVVAHTTANDDELSAVLDFLEQCSAELSTVADSSSKPLEAEHVA
jgi:HD-GYP domain-containing protein (c-di-GMP phosphodiesterase class II)